MFLAAEARWANRWREVPTPRAGEVQSQVGIDGDAALPKGRALDALHFREVIVLV